MLTFLENYLTKIHNDRFIKKLFELNQHCYKTHFDNLSENIEDRCNLIEYGTLLFPMHIKSIDTLLELGTTVSKEKLEELATKHCRLSIEIVKDYLTEEMDKSHCELFDYLMEQVEIADTPENAYKIYQRICNLLKAMGVYPDGEFNGKTCKEILKIMEAKEISINYSIYLEEAEPDLSKGLGIRYYLIDQGTDTTELDKRLKTALDGAIKKVGVYTANIEEMSTAMHTLTNYNLDVTQVKNSICEVNKDRSNLNKNIETAKQILNIND